MVKLYPGYQPEIDLCFRTYIINVRKLSRSGACTYHHSDKRLRHPQHICQNKYRPGFDNICLNPMSIEELKEASDPFLVDLILYSFAVLYSNGKHGDALILKAVYFILRLKMIFLG